MAPERFLLLVFVAACGAATPAPPAADAKPKAADGSASSDPCAKLPECPARCPQGVDAIAGRGCGSEGLRCGDDAIECRCADGQWTCAPYVEPEGMVAACSQKCRG